MQYDFLQRENLKSAVNYNILFVVLGPALPKSLYGHAMIPLQNELVIIGGYSGGKTSSLYSLTCQNGECQWSKMTQELKKPRWYHTALAVPEEFADCT